MHSQPTTTVLGSVALLVSSGVWPLAVDVRNLATPVSVRGASDMRVLKWGEQGAPDKIALRAHLLQRSSDLSHTIKRVWSKGTRLEKEGSQRESRGRNRASLGAKGGKGQESRIFGGKGRQWASRIMGGGGRGCARGGKAQGRIPS